MIWVNSWETSMCGERIRNSMEREETSLSILTRRGLPPSRRRLFSINGTGCRIKKMTLTNYPPRNGKIRESVVRCRVIKIMDEFEDARGWWRESRISVIPVCKSFDFVTSEKGTKFIYYTYSLEQEQGICWCGYSDWPAPRQSLLWNDVKLLP